MTQPLMPKATAVWLIDKTSLTFEQVADFVGMHPLEVQAIADGEVAQGIIGYDPVLNGQLTRVGSGLYGMLLFAVLTVFIAGLMIGRTPEYLGKTIRAREVKLSIIGVLIMPAGLLITLGIAAVVTALLWALYRYTRFGLATSAVAENERAASALGLSPDRIATINSSNTRASRTPIIRGRLANRASVASMRIADSPPTSYRTPVNDRCSSPSRRLRTSSWVRSSAGPCVVATLTR